MKEIWNLMQSQIRLILIKKIHFLNRVKVYLLYHVSNRRYSSVIYDMFRIKQEVINNNKQINE